jgi:hypothetical protein
LYEFQDLILTPALLPLRISHVCHIIIIVIVIVIIVIIIDVSELDLKAEWSSVA